MTVETQTNKVLYIGNGITIVFPLPFPVLKASHVRVFLKAPGEDFETEITTGFSVSGVGSNAVTLTMAEPVTSGVKLIILRELPYVQDMDIQNGGAFHADILENTVDVLEMQIQQLAEKLGRAVLNDLDATTSVSYADIMARTKEAIEAAAGALLSQESAAQSASEATEAKDIAIHYGTLAEQILALQVEVSGLLYGEEPTVSYDAGTGILSFGIPAGPQGLEGPPGIAPVIDVIDGGGARRVQLKVVDGGGATTIRNRG